MRYVSIAAVDRPFDDVYISPHLDDVALSCGGRILSERALSRSVLVVTVFTADAGPCQNIPPRVRARVGEMEKRRREDERAMERLGVDFLWLGYPEAIFRDRVYHTLYGAFSRMATSDHDVIARLASEFHELLKRVRPQRVYWPLGVGHHADHRVVFEAGVRVAEGIASRGSREGSGRSADAPSLSLALSECGNGPDLYFYEDAPYALIPHLVEHRLDMVRARSLQEHTLESCSIWARTRDAYAAMMSLASVRAEVGRWAWRAAAYGFLLVHFARGRRAQRRASPRLWLVPELCEIGKVLPHKLDILAEYGSQIAPVLGDLHSYVRLRLAYSQRLATLALGHVLSGIPRDPESAWESQCRSPEGTPCLEDRPTSGVFERVWRIVRINRETPETSPAIHREGVQDQDSDALGRGCGRSRGETFPGVHSTIFPASAEAATVSGLAR
jgi:LmbE family N-acetylglucosaminyl deacetylase